MNGYFHGVVGGQQVPDLAAPGIFRTILDFGFGLIHNLGSFDGYFRILYTLPLAKITADANDYIFLR